jgi:hypothetical protein
VAVICVLPTLNAVTAPVDDTDATDEVVDDHVTVRPVSVAPLASLSVTVACVPCPTEVDDEPNATVTVATGAGGAAVTVKFVLSLLPSLVARMRDDPVLSAVMRPVGEIVATVALADCQVTTRPVRTLPLSSLATAIACVVWPTLIVDDDSDKATEATGASDPPPLVAVLTGPHAISSAPATPSLTIWGRAFQTRGR